MGSASRKALEAGIAALDAQHSTDLATGEQLLAATRAIASSVQLRALLADSGIEEQGKSGVIRRVFGGFTAVLPVLDTVVAQRWSNGEELVDGLETLGYRAVAASAQGDGIETELAAFGQIVRSDAQLELAMGTSLGTPEAKLALVDRLLSGASQQTRVIVRHIVASLGRRRFAESLRRAAAAVADQSGQSVAVVRTAVALGDAQLQRLEAALNSRYGRRLSISQVIDPTLIGGVRISVGDDVIDGSVATRLNDLRLQLAG